MAMAVAAAVPETDVRALESEYIGKLLNSLTSGMYLAQCRSFGFEYSYREADQHLQDPVTLAALEVIEAELDERPVLVTAHAGPLLRTRPGGPWRIPSRHGAMVESPDQAWPHHAILLIKVERGRIFHLDPYFPVEPQPFSLTRSEFVHAWLGEWAYWLG